MDEPRDPIPVPIRLIVSNDQTQGAGGRRAGRESRSPAPYGIIEDAFHLLTDKGARPLSNGAFWITEEIVEDDGLIIRLTFRVEGRLADGSTLPARDVPANQFNSLNWITQHWGSAPVVYAGPNTRDHVRVAIQMHSAGKVARRTVYKHTGWRQLGERRGFLHGGGAILPDGDDTQVEVEIGAGEGHMRHYRFAAEGGDLAADIRASLRLLDLSPDKPELGVALLAGTYRAPLGEAAPIDHGLFLAGPTGARKSEAAALAQAHFGRRFDSRHFPGTWEDTPSDLEAKAHAAKDCVFVIDDFRPRGPTGDVQRLHAQADRMFRSVGNQTGRGRRTPDLRQRPAYYPRGLVLATGEDIPRGASVRARMAILEIGPADIDNKILSELQTAAREGALERAMAGYLRWLAAEMDDWCQSAPAFLRHFRDLANAEGFATSHPRAADTYASFLLALDCFFLFAEQSGALDATTRAERYRHCDEALRALIQAQGDLQSDQDEVRQFLRLLKSCLNKGGAHVSDAADQGAPAEQAHFWGWRTIRGADGGPEIRPLGARIGWVDSTRLYLDGDAAFEAAGNLARATGEAFAISQRTLWRRLHERGLLLDVLVESGRTRLAAKHSFGGLRQRVYVLRRQQFENE